MIRILCVNGIHTKNRSYKEIETLTYLFNPTHITHLKYESNLDIRKRMDFMEALEIRWKKIIWADGQVRNPQHLVGDPEIQL